MAKLAGGVVVVVVVISDVVVVVVVVAILVLSDVVLLIGVVAGVVVCILTTSGRLFSVAMVTIPAMHVATNMINQTITLNLVFMAYKLQFQTYPLLRPNSRISSIMGLPRR